MKIAFGLAVICLMAFTAYSICPGDGICTRQLDYQCGQLENGSYVWFDNECCLNMSIKAETAQASNDCPKGSYPWSPEQTFP